MIENQNFGQAIEALKEGKRVARQGWNGKGMFIFMQVPATIPADVIPKMQSLPQSVKDEFERRHQQYKEDIKQHYKFDVGSTAANNEQTFSEENFAPYTINYKNQLAMVYPDSTIYGWVASPSDVLEEDWCILD